jgi:MFS family permease
LRQSLDTVGAFVGPLAAIGLMVLTANNFTAVFWIAVIPAFLALGLMIFGVEEPPRKEDTAPKPRWHWSDAKRLSATFWAVVAVAGVLTLARFSEEFLILRSQNVGLPIALVTQGLLASMVADTAPVELRGTAFGVFNFTGGIAMLAASVVAGALWDAYGPAVTFAMGAIFTAVALAGLIVIQGRFKAAAAR